MMTNDRSDAALHERLELAEKATKWGCSGEPQANEAHIAANSPDVVKADIEEILSLRAENERLNKEANWLAKTLGVQVKDSFGCVWCWLSESDMCNGDCTESLRNAARKAVEDDK